MKVSFWKVGFAALFLASVGYGFMELRGANGVSGLVEKQREATELERQNLVMRKEIEAKRARIDRLRDNPEEQELEIRKGLKLMKQGEKSFILQERQK